MRALVAKIGSSTLLDADGRPRDEVLRRLTLELAELARAGHRPVLVSSGAVAAGLGALGVDGRPDTLPVLQAASAVGQGLLFERYRALFTDQGVTPAQVLLTSADLERREPYLNARNLLTTLLDGGVIPVVNENDATATEALMVGDNDRLAAHVAMLLGAELLVLLTDREGIMAPGDPDPLLVEEIAPGTPIEELPLASLRSSGVGRGGIVAKARAAMMAAESGVTAIIASGRRPGVLPAVSAGRPVGTRFPAAAPGAVMTARPELDRLAISWLTDLLVPRDAVERALGPADIERRHLAAGDLVFEEGARGDALYMIVGGEVEVVKGGATAAVLGPGCYFGEMALMGDPVRTATVRCRAPTRLLVLREGPFRSLVERVPELGARLRETAEARRTAPVGVA